MSGLLKHLKGWASAVIGTLNDSEFALLEDVVSVIVVGDALLLTGIVGTCKGGTVEHGLLHWMQLINGLHLLMAVLA